MDKEDARYQSLERLHERRKQVVRLHRKGCGVMGIVELSGLCYPTVRRVIDRYKEGGASSLKPAARGHRVGDGRRLSEVQEQTIQRIICDKRPEAVQAWLDEQYPAIEAQAKAQGGEIHWGDQTALVNTDVRGRSYAPAGKTPVAFAVGGTRQKLSMLATVTNQGKTRWMIIDEAFNADRLIEFLAALIKDVQRKVFLILDNLRVHHSKPVKAWVAQRSERIELFYLPSYSPELNPEGRLNADLKHAIGSKVPARTKAKLKSFATQHMQALEHAPERVKKYFQGPRVKYAA